MRGQNYDPSIPGRSVRGQAFEINPRVTDGIADVGGLDIGVPILHDEFEINNDTNASEDTDSLDISLEFNYDFGPVTLKSITAYSDFEYEPFADNDFTDAATSGATNMDIASLTAESKSFQQEIHLASNTDSALEWLVGAFYFTDKIEETFSIQRLIPGTALPAPGGGTTNFVFDRRTETDVDSWAVFGQGTFHITDRFSITAGARHTEDDKDYELEELGFLGTLGFNPTLDLDEKFDETTYRIGGEFYINDSTMTYASFSTGFRSGGFNRFLGTPDEQIFDPETIDAYEVGLKLDNLFGGRMRLNIAGFYQEIEDQQVSTVISVAGTGQSGFFNAGETEIYGIELDFLALPTDAWYIAGTFALA